MDLAVDSIIYVVGMLQLLFLVEGDIFAAYSVNDRLPGVIRVFVVIPTDAAECFAECGVTLSTILVNLL